MKDKIGFNLIFAIMAFPIGSLLLKHTDFTNLTFKKPALDTLYLIIFIALVFFTFKKQNKEEEK